VAHSDWLPVPLPLVAMLNWGPGEQVGMNLGVDRVDQVALPLLVRTGLSALNVRTKCELRTSKSNLGLPTWQQACT